MGAQGLGEGMDRIETPHTAEPAPFVLHKTVVLVGMMGSGKTAIGKALAARLGAPFVDSDAEIERAANASIAEVFARDGQRFFRAREAEVITRLLQGPPAVLSTGGGAFLAADTRAAIAQLGVSLWLHVDLETLWERVRHKTTRPLLHTANPKQTLTDLLTERTPIYRQSMLSLDVGPEYSIIETTELALDALLADPTILEPAK